MKNTEAKERSKVEMGKVYATRGVLLSIPPEQIALAVARHLICDWGDLCEEDREINEDAYLNGGRLFSRYLTEDGEAFYVITEADREMTTLLLPSEY